MARILVVDDDKAVGESLRSILQYEKHEVELAPGGKEALAFLEKSPFELVLLDVRMPGMDGFEALERIRKVAPAAAVIMISAHANIPQAVEAAKKGAFDFLEKPLDRERLLLVVRNALEHCQLLEENRALRQNLVSANPILGNSPALRALVEEIRRVARSEARVLIYGENGSGKELVARAIHQLSPRASRPFVAVNCAALPGELVESELFGHEEGAFTGAKSRRAGRFEQAHGGTLFLDEVGDMSLPAQAKVLRVLEEGTVQRLGAARGVNVDVRVLSATNKNLEEAIKKKEFRDDLYFRLNVFPLRVPPLRERQEDIALLGAHFLEESCRRDGLPPKRLGAEAIESLQKHAWPGNVRELRHLMERLAIALDAEEIRGSDVTRVLGGPSQFLDPFRECKTLDEFRRATERAFLETRLKANQWNISKTAQELDITRSQLYEKMDKLGLR